MVSTPRCPWRQRRQPRLTISVAGPTMRYDNLVEITSLQGDALHGMQQLIEWKHIKRRDCFDNYTFEDMPNRLHRLSSDLGDRPGINSYSAFLCVSKQKTFPGGECRKQIRVVPYVLSPGGGAIRWAIPPGDSTLVIHHKNAVDHLLVSCRTLFRILGGHTAHSTLLMSVIGAFMNRAMMPTNAGILSALQARRLEDAR